MAPKKEASAVKVLVDGVTFGSAVYAAGQVILNPTDEMLALARSDRVNDSGKKLAKICSKQEALKAAKAYDRGEGTLPIAYQPPPADEEAAMVVGGNAPAAPAEGVDDTDDEDDSDDADDPDEGDENVD